MYNKYKDKVTFICCDFKIDLLKSNEHSNTASLSFYSLIVKLSRKTNEGSKLIDNIVINDTEGKK